MVFWEKIKIFIYFNGCIEKNFWKPKSKGKFVIFLQKIALEGIMTLVSKVREVSPIFQTTVEVVVFARNLKRGQRNLPFWFLLRSCGFTPLESYAQKLSQNLFS